MLSFERFAVNRAAYKQVGVGGPREVVIWRIERGYLPGFLPKGEVRMDASADVSAGLLTDVLWQGAWMDVALALARQIAAQEESAAAFAVLDQPELWDHRGKFRPVSQGWTCFDYPFYLVVRRELFDGNCYIAHLMERQW